MEGCSIAVEGDWQISLEVFVTPLWRFEAGDRPSALAAFFGKQPITLEADGRAEREANPGWWASWKAKRSVKKIQAIASQAAGQHVQWNDEGDCVLSEQLLAPISSLLAYLGYVQRGRKDNLVPPDEDEWYELECFKEMEQDDRLPILLTHGFYNDILLPVAFAGCHVYAQEPSFLPGETFDHYLASSQALLRELELYLEITELDKRDNEDEESPTHPIWWAYEELHKIASTSVKAGLPAIFWG